MTSTDDSRYDAYETLHVDVTANVAFATIDAPPINVMSAQLFGDLTAFGNAVADDDAVRAVVLRSAHPDFFIAHFDVELLIGAAVDTEPVKPTGLISYHRMCETYRTMPKATICEIAGRVGGGGNELAMSCDMRFGAVGRTVINQMEVPIGIIPGGTGTQNLPALVGRGRAMEIILGGDDLDAETAEAWGLLNRALPPEELRPFVDRLATRIGSFPPGSVQLAKASILNAGEPDRIDGLNEEAYLFQKSMRLPGTKELMQRFIDAGGQTADGERRVGALVADLHR